MKKILLGQLLANGDCLYATAIARQIKVDYPGCHLTWAISSLCASILDGNPHVDKVWVVPINNRAEIKNAWTQFEKEALDPDRTIKLYKTITKVHSGFVHGASPQIMDMYGGNPPHFHTKGMLGTPRIDEHTDALWHYMYRTLLSHLFVAIALGAEEHVEILTEHKLKFEKDAGKDY